MIQNRLAEYLWVKAGGFNVPVKSNKPVSNVLMWVDYTFWLSTQPGHGAIKITT